MRLLNAKTLQVETMVDSNIPAYAILTHTWAEEEVTLRDIVGNGAEKKEGYKKIKKCCEETVKDQLTYVWIDTCCIDATNSVELSEAINSMYRWYKNSTCCYAYLSDVSSLPEHSSFKSEFSRSRWFTRGWTLQELLAPRDTQFYTQEWHHLGSKLSLSESISRITGISIEMLLSGYMPSASIATRISWASKRQTTREEDRAYCLLGIFGVNMPLLYGEGLPRAFARLQEEIMKESDDHSLFAWEVSLGMARNSRMWGESFNILATTPESFANSSTIISFRRGEQSHHYRMTNKGLKIRLPLLPSDQPARCIALLECQFDKTVGYCIGIPLVRNIETGTYWRAPGPIQNISYREADDATDTSIYIRRSVFQPGRPYQRTFWVRAQSLKEHGFEITEVYPPDLDWNSMASVLKLPVRRIEARQRAAFLFCNDVTHQQIAMVATIDDQRRQGSVHIAPKPNDATLRQCVSRHLAQDFQGGVHEQQSRMPFALRTEGGLKEKYCHVTAEISVKSISHSKVWILDANIVFVKSLL